MKILHIAEPFATGVLSFLIDLTQKQVEKHEIYIAWGLRPLTPVNVEELFDSRVHLIFIPEFKGAISSVISLKAYIHINQVYNDIKPDIVHLHSSASGFIGRWAIPTSKTKVFYTPHGYSFLMQGGGGFRKWMFWGIEWLSARRNALTVACSEGEYYEAKRLSSNCKYINNGIKTNDIERYSKYTGLKPKVCTSGRILMQKNPILFNEIARLLPHVHFIWVGEGELKTELTSPNIEITGWIKREDALQLISDSSFFILPSLWEGLPISLLEGMFLRKICLASNVIGNRDVIKNGDNGFICNTASEFANLIKDCLDNKIDSKKIAENAHYDVLTNYNVERMFLQYEEIYNNQ